MNDSQKETIATRIKILQDDILQEENYIKSLNDRMSKAMNELYLKREMIDNLKENLSDEEIIHIWAKTPIQEYNLTIT